MKTLFRKFRHPRLLFWLILVESISLWSIDSLYARAQIVPDRTLGDESSVVVPNVEIEGKKSERVEGGAIRGNNLFHSFQEFNIDAGRGAYFANPSAIENIFTRVTGANPSEIFGTLGVLGNANLFFLNPNGIIFGANASLDVRGSFVATTADSIIFPDGKEFNATNTDVPPLLTVEVQQPIGLKFEGESGIITNAADLAVASRQTLSLSGGEVEHTGNLTAPGGRVEVLGTESVALLEDATIDVSAPTGGGTVLIGGDFQGQGTVPNAKRTYVDDNVTINTDALTNGNGGKVIVWSNEVTGFYGQINARGGIESGDGGLVEVSGKEHLIFRGKVDTSAVNGFSGTLLLDPTNIIIADGSGDEAGDGTDSFAGNNSGVVGSILTAPLSEIDDTAPTTIYESELEGLSGDTNIILQATNNITLQDLSDDGLNLAAGEGVIALSADADGNGMGDFVMEDSVADTIFTNGRNIAISGASLTVGSIDTTKQNSNGGAITLSANENISAGSINSSSSDNASPVATSGIGGAINLSANGSISTGNLNSSSAANASANATSSTGGTINLSAGGSISTGDINSSSLAFTPSDISNISGNAGDISLQAGDALNFGDIEAIGLLGGNILLDSNANLSISDRIIISLSVGSGVGGDIKLTAPSVSLSNSAQVFNFTIGDTGKGGALIVDTDLESGRVEILNENEFTPRSLSNPLVTLIRNNIPGTSFLTATGAVADGGDLTINTSELIIRNNIDLRKLNDSIIFSPLVGAAAVNKPAINLLNLPISSGKGGNLTVNASKSVTITGRDEPGAFTATPDIQGAIFVSSVVTALTTIAIGSGDGGNLTINTEQLTVEFGAAVASGSSDREATKGNGGELTVNATQVKLQGRGGIASSTFSSGLAGKLTVNADAGSVTLLDGATIAADTFSSGKAGDLVISTAELFVDNGSRIGTTTFAEGSGATLTVNASDSVKLVGTSLDGSLPSGIFAFSNLGSTGNAGNIDLQTGSLSLTDGAVVSAQTEGTGNAGDIKIDSPQLTIDRGASISAFTQGSGNGGTITVNAPQAVLLTDNSELTVETSSAGKPGDITITTPNLTIGKDAEISATATETSTNTERGGSITINSSNLDLTGKLGIFAETQGVAPAGTLNIQPDNNQPNLDIQFTDTALISASTRASGTGGDINLTAPETINITGQGKVAVETTGTGNAGSINITTQNFNLSQQTEISASTFSSGRAGNINITANNFNLTEGVTVVTNTTSSGQAGDIQLQIRDNLNLVDSAIAASTAPNSQGKGGNIDIDPQVVTLNNSQIAVNSQGEGTGGSITLQAGNLNLDNQSAISAETLSTDGGNIEIALGENLILRDNSQISATAGTARAGGDGGNIEIDAQFILAFPTEDSNITANAFFGNGGNISITAEGILGLEFRENPTILSDITASSEFGLAGTVNIDTLETDPNRGLITLPQQAVDTQVALGCDVDGEGAVTFYNLGRGGLATSPHDFLIPDTVIGEWLPLTPSFESFDSEHKLGFELNSQQRTTVIRQLVPVCKR